MNLTLDAAKALRDGGIDATAALNQALKQVMDHSPEAEHPELKRAFGHIMWDVLDATVNVAIKAYPELKPEEEEWKAVVKACASSRLESL